MSHPMQPLYRDIHGVIRFTPNMIIRYLVDAKVIDLNAVARLPVRDEDREQLAMLMGYSVSGFGELSFVSDATYEAVQAAAEEMDAASAH